jgi:hypothetical protein
VFWQQTHSSNPHSLRKGQQPATLLRLLSASEYQLVESFCHCRWFSCFAFPYCDHFPSLVAKLLLVPAIAIAVLRNLLLPESSVGFRLAKATITLRTAMPEAPMHKNNSSPFWQDDIRAAWQIGTM